MSTIGKCVPAESYWTTRADGAVRLHMEKSGPLSLPPETVVDMFERTVGRFPDHVALGIKRGRSWKKWTYREYYQDCRTAAKALIKLGLEEFRGVAIIGSNSPEWLFFYLAAIMCGGLPTGIYTDSLAEACHYVALNCSANIIVVEDNVQLQKILQVWGRLPSLKAVVQYSGQPQEKCNNVYSWSEFMALGLQVPDTVLDRRIRALVPNKCCSLVYTSGTTGNPKGVMLSHDNVVWYAKILKNYLEMNGSREVFLSYLPLSHVVAQMFDIYQSILHAGTIYFAQPNALQENDGFIEIMKEVRPTLFFGVPRVWEKIYEILRLNIGSLVNDSKLLSWAKNIGYKGNMNRIAGISPPPEWDSANRLVFQKIHRYLGLDRCKIILSGTAPLSKEIFDYFLSINLLALSMYGMSELTGASQVNLEKKCCIGSVGTSLPGIKVKILNPDKDGNGEVCHNGRNIFMGYLNMKEKTMETLEDQGYVLSGDFGRVDKDGFLFINGRIKELITTSGGQYIAPFPIEDAVKKEIPLLSNCILIGDKRKFLSILLTLKVLIDSRTSEPTEKLTDEAIEMCRKLGSKAVTVQDVKNDKILSQVIQRGIERYNQKAVSGPHKIQEWAILDTDFSVPGGELGPTLKLKRNVVIKRYENLLDLLYAPVKLKAKY